MSVVLFSLPGSPPIIGDVVSDKGDYFIVDCPVVLIKEESSIYTMPYMPLAKSNKVFFSKASIVAVADVEDDLLNHYNEMVVTMRNKSIEPVEKKLDKQIKQADISFTKSKYFH
jgi:hypothetical protein